MKVCFETFGCRLNRAEALQEEAIYLARGWTRTESHDDADLIVIRGCSVTGRAQHDCEHLINHIRRKYPFKRLVITGCLPSADKNYSVRDDRLRVKDGESAFAAVPRRTARAYLKVQDGCNGECTFCIVPTFRGRSRSVPFAECLERARRFVAVGYHEIVVTGCNLSMYASDGKSIADLAAALAEINPACRIRLGSLEPSPVAGKVIETVAAHRNLCRFLHIPVQSGSNRILSAMGRPYRLQLVEDLVNQAERLMPRCGLGCDIMTGFPDETDTDFLATQTLFRRLPFNRVHVFPFSERPGTAAVKLLNSVPRETRRSRAHDIAKIADESRAKFARRFVGHTVDVVIEDETTLGGWTGEYLWCQVGSEKAAAYTHASGRHGNLVRRKDLVTMQVHDVKGHVLVGEPV